MAVGLQLLAGLLVFCLCVHKFIIYPAFISPLSRIPNAHILASITPLWMLWIRYWEKENATIHAAHEKYGPVVRLGPNEVSVNCVRGGIQTIYAGGFDKHEFYPNQFFNFGRTNMFSTVHSKPHSIRKRMISNIYSKSYLQASKTLAAISSTILYGRFLQTLSTAAKANEPVDFFNVISATTMDFVTAYLFGLRNGTNFSENKRACLRFLDIYHSRHAYTFWPRELPWLTSILEKLGIRLVPRFVDAANQEIEELALEMCNKAAGILDDHANEIETLRATGDFPEVYSQLSAAISKESSKEAEASGTLETPDERRFVIASELLDHFAAGFDTSGITLTYAIHELSQRPGLQTALRRELCTLDPPITLSSAPHLPSAKALDALPLLHAILYETLRLHAAIPGPQPRIAPAGGCTLGPEGEYGDVPGGTRVSAQAWSLHRTASAFVAANEWRPERWLCDGSSSIDNHNTNTRGDVGVGVGDGDSDDSDRDRNNDGAALDERARFRAASTAREMHRCFWAFGSGGRMCVGSNLALFQMKHIIAAVYSNFTTAIVDDSGIEQIDAYTAPPRVQKLIISLKPAPAAPAAASEDD